MAELRRSRHALLCAFSAAVTVAVAATCAGESVPIASLSPIVPFVVPTDRPTAAEVDALVGNLRAHGFDQFMLYPGDGLGYDYLSEDYFGMVGAFLEGARRRGMKTWLYDEFNWPSGTAHGRVPSENEACLYRELVATTNAAGEVSWQIVVSRGLNVDNYCYDGNNLEPAGVKRFMDLTHHAYGRRFRDYLGTTVPGIFTDEPGHWSSAWRLAMPTGTWLRLPYWSGMEAEYARASGGRDFRADCAKALRDGTLQTSDIFRRWTEIRGIRYRKTYFDPIASWCRTNGLVSTGHLFCEGYPAGCAGINGLPLHVLKGLAKPGIDLVTSTTDRKFEWLTLAFAQAAAARAGRPGSVELFGIGPCDLSFATMRKMFWVSALHRIDTFFVALYHTRGYRFLKKDSWAMFTSPDQPWFDEMPLLHDAARQAAQWARKTPRCEIALVYPQRQLGSYDCVRGIRPDLPGICGELTWNGYTYDLIEEDEKTDKPIVLDWDGNVLFERKSGTRFDAWSEVVAWIARRTGRAPKPGFLRRSYADGSWAEVDLTTGAVTLSTESVRVADGEATPLPNAWSLSLSGPSRRRLWFWRSKTVRKKMPWEKDAHGPSIVEKRDQPENTAIFAVDAPLENVRFVLRDYPRGAFSLTLDGKPLTFDRAPAVSLVPAFNGISRESEPRMLAPGRHVVALKGGVDSKMYLPVAWIVGDFAEKTAGHLSPVSKTASNGALAATGLAAFAGTATYAQNVPFIRGERLRVDAGGAVVRVRYGGRDLGARGWAPFEWTIPDDLAGRDLPLEIAVTTSVRPIFGSETSPDAKLDHALWIPSATVDPSPVGLRGCWKVRPGEDWRIVAADQTGPAAVILRGAPSRPAEILWRWTPSADPHVRPEHRGWFLNLDECKPVDGGATLLVNASGGGVAAIDTATTQTVWYAKATCGGAGPHSLCRLPDGRIAVANSTGCDALEILDVLKAPLDPLRQTRVRAAEISGAHGVEWDAHRQSLFVLGYTNLYEYAYRPETMSLVERRRWRYDATLGDCWGHDLVPDAKGGYFITNHAGVWRIDPETGAFSRVLDRKDAKSFSRDPVRGDLVQLPTEKWWSDRLIIVCPDGRDRTVGPFPGARFYKARWYR